MIFPRPAIHLAQFGAALAALGLTPGHESTALAPTEAAQQSAALGFESLGDREELTAGR